MRIVQHEQSATPKECNRRKVYRDRVKNGAKGIGIVQNSA